MANIRQPADGAPGPVGPPGKLGIVRDHVESRVYYERDLGVAVDGALYQADRDTAAASSLVDCSRPPHGRSFLCPGRRGYVHAQRCASPLRKRWDDFHTQKHVAWFQQSDQELVLLWVIVPPGLERFF